MSSILDKIIVPAGLQGIAMTGPLSSAFKLPFYVFLLAVLSGCEHFITAVAPPSNQMARQAVFADEQSANAAARGIYSEMASPSNGFSSGNAFSVTMLAGLSADELINYSLAADFGEFTENAISPSNAIAANYLWGNAFKFIYYANALLEGVRQSDALPASARDQLTGEARFIRAFCHFYLVNLFGAVPVITTTSYEDNRAKPRQPATEVYEQIIEDLMAAKQQLNQHAGKDERIRPDKAAATALLARVYLYTAQWQQAAAAASEVIESPLYRLEAELNRVFLAGSKEAIWQLMPVSTVRNTEEGGIFVLTSSPLYVSLDSSLVSCFEPGDKRAAQWMGALKTGSNTYYFPFKYKIKDTATPKTEYSMVLRLAEQYLIRAEAEINMGNLPAAARDIDMIRSRAGLTRLTGAQSSKAQLTEILHQERRRELFCEWGHRWLDLNRTSRADQILGSIKPGWKPTSRSYPIPKSELDNNPSLVQNPGY